MYRDAIVEKVRRIKEVRAKHFDYDIRAMVTNARGSITGTFGLQKSAFCPGNALVLSRIIPFCYDT